MKYLCVQTIFGRAGDASFNENFPVTGNRPLHGSQDSERLRFNMSRKLDPSLFLNMLGFRNSCQSHVASPHLLK
jgi:hypothetical protein